MATQAPKVFKFEDNETGKVYQIEADPDATEAEAIDYLGSLDEGSLKQFEYVPPNAIKDAPRERTVATKEWAEVPGAREYAEELFFKGTPYSQAAEAFTQKFPEVQFDTENAPAQWAENLEYAKTPSGRNYFANNSPFAPVNVPTGIEDPEAPDSVAGEILQSGARSIHQMANMYRGAAALGADLVGADETAESWLDDYLEQSAAIDLNLPSGAGMAKDIDSFGDAAMWGGSVIGELLPQLAGSLGAGAAGSYITKKAIAKSVKQAVEDQVAAGLTRKAAQELVAREMQKKIVRGGIAGATAQSVTQESGSIYGDTYGETGERMPWTSLLAGTAAGSLDALMPANILRKVGGPAAQDAMVESLVKRVGKEAASNFLLEGGTEVLQTIIEQLPAGGPIDWDQVVEAGLRGGFGGSVAGGATGAYEGNRQNKAAPPVKRSTIPEGSAPISVPTETKPRTKAYREQIETTRSEVETRVQELTGNWENAPEVEVHTDFTKLKGVSNNAIGVYADGKLQLNTKQILAEAKLRNVAPDDIVSAVTFHEGLGHHGLTQLFGEALDDQLAKMLGSSTVLQNRVQKWLEKHPDAYLGDPNRDLRAAEELFAEKSENGQLPASFKNQMLNTIKDFGRRMGLNLQYSSRELDTILGMAHAAVVSGKGRDASSNGFKFMYAGEKAETASVGRLELAKALERQGRNVGPEGDSRISTGWFKAPDGKWRFEISDKEVSLIPSSYEDGSSVLTNLSKMNEWVELSEVIDHPELFAAYPELQNIPVLRRQYDGGDKSIPDSGMYNPPDEYNSEFIWISSGASDAKALSILLHEVQHAVQEIEDFARGGNPEGAIEIMPDELLVKGTKQFIKHMEAQPAPNASEKAYKKEFLGRIQNMLKSQNYRSLRNFFQNDGRSAFEAYSHLFGEVEARDVQTRQEYDDFERQIMSPYTSEPEIDPESYIFDFNSAPSEATVYQGSPHDHDGYRNDKIGTGEGNAAFGHGHYFAGKKALADHYRRMLSNGVLRVTIPSSFLVGIKKATNVTEKKLAKLIEEHPLVEQAIPKTEENSIPKPLEFASAFGDGSPQTYVPYKVERRRVRYSAETLIDYMGDLGLTLDEAVAKAKEEFGDNSFYSNELFDLAGAVLADLQLVAKRGGKLYEVEIPDNGYLLWDKTLDEQSPEIKEILKKADVPFTFEKGTQQTGKELYEYYTSKFKTQKRASNYLHSLGLIGIKYQNGDTRGRTPVSDEDFNYVIFDEKTPKIVNKYMMMSSPDKVEFTPEEIDAMDPDEIFEGQNALAMLEKMIEGYTPMVLSNDELQKEAELRGFTPGELLRSPGVKPGELTKRLFMYDIAASKLQDKITTLYAKMQDGQASGADYAAHAKALYQMQEVTQKIFDVQGEIGRSLNAMKTVNFTKRRVGETMEIVAQFQKNSPFEYLNDPDEYYKFATQIQQQIADAKEKMKASGASWLGNALNLPRAIMSTLDLSAPLRQGLFLIHKPQWWSSFVNMFRYWGDEKAFQDLQEDIVSRNTYPLMQAANLALSNADGKMNQREEDFQTEWAQKIPGFGKLVRMSERGYVGFLNKLRADVFDQLVANLGDNYTEQDLKDIGRFVNAASGRGNLPKALQGSAPVLNGLLFSPRLMASRIVMTTALVDPRTYTTMNKTARNEYVKSLLSVGSMALLILSLAAMAGAEVEDDPRSSDFAKIKVGNTRYDILGGEAQYITLAARVALWSTKTADGQIKRYGPGIGKTTVDEAIIRFLRNKTAPIPSFIWDFFAEENAVGQPFESDQAIVERFTPMIISDIMENAGEVGTADAAMMGVPAFFGVGVSTYASRSLDTERDLDGPESFEMADAVDGDYGNYEVKNGTVMLDDGAQREWENRINFYYKEWMKDEMKDPAWKTATDDEKRDIIKAVRNDARKEAKADMLELLQIPEGEQ